MRKYFIAVFILCISITILPQELSRNELDSLYNIFTFARGVNTSDKMQKQFEEYPEITKCGLGLVTSIKQNLNNFSIEQQNVLFKILDRPIDLPNTAVSSNGFFRVHYTSTGNNAIGYDINLLLSALDSAFNFEINYLGYPAPPSDGSEGGDAKYDIYIQNIPGFYGYTQPENKIGTSSWSSFMVIDNDFGTGYYTHGIDAARVTIAHEFHHAIQIGNYAPINSNEPFRGSDTFFYELTSTAFEEFVFDYVNDYYAYMPSYFQNPERSMPLNDGYNLAIWNIYLQNNFGFDILRRQWDLIPGNDALKAIAISIDENGSTFGNELNKFGIWTYFTNSRNIYPGEYFEEASSYPLINPTVTSTLVNSSQTYAMSVNPAANYFLRINLPSPDGVFNTIITNSDYQKAIDNSTQYLDFAFSIYRDTVSGTRVINEHYSVRFSKDNQTFWNNAGILNNVVVYGDSSYSIPNLEGETFAYPMPIKRSSANTLNITFQSNGNVGEEVDINIYSAGAELYYSGTKIIQSAYLKNSNKYCEVSLNKYDFDFPSGVYIYVVKHGEDIFKGKLVIFND